MRPVLISPEFIIKQKTARGNYTYLTGIDRFRSYVKIDLSSLPFFGCRCSANFDEIEII